MNGALRRSSDGGGSHETDSLWGDKYERDIDRAACCVGACRRTARFSSPTSDLLRGTCRSVLRLDRLLDCDQSWAVHYLAERIAGRLDIPDPQPIEFVLSHVLIEQRLELVPIECKEPPKKAVDE